MTLRVKAHPFQDRDIFPEWLISVHHNSKKRPRLSVQSEQRGLHSVVSSVLAACSTLRRARSGSHPRTKKCHWRRISTIDWQCVFIFNVYHLLTIFHDWLIIAVWFFTLLRPFLLNDCYFCSFDARYTIFTNSRAHKTFYISIVLISSHHLPIFGPYRVIISENSGFSDFGPT